MTKGVDVDGRSRVSITADLHGADARVDPRASRAGGRAGVWACGRAGMRLYASTVLPPLGLGCVRRVGWPAPAPGEPRWAGPSTRAPHPSSRSCGCPPPSRSQDLPSSSTPLPLEPGAIGHGARLAPPLQEAISAARHSPPHFASLRNIDHATPEELWETPLPDVLSMARLLAPTEQYAARRTWDGRGDWRRWLPDAPAGDISLAMLVGEENLRRWHRYVEATQAAFDALKAGAVATHPGDFVIKESDLPAWAQGVVWNAEDPARCVPVARSTRHTVFPGERQVDRAQLRRVAEELGWERVDPDIIEQLGHGGAELRSTAPLHTTACWHHAGVGEHWAIADGAVQEERREGWTRVSQSPLPFVPTTFSPRDVVLQEKGKLVEGQLELHLKPRVTHDMSAVPRQLGGRKLGTSVNAGVPGEEKAIPVLPRIQDYARAQAVCALAAPSAAEQDLASAHVYGIDETKAYCFLPVQQAEHFTGCYLWPDEDGVVRPHVSMRMVFGGSAWPNRFERFSLLQCAWIQHLQRQFDAAHPYPPAAMAWMERRADLQRQGRLPAGAAQLWPAGIEPYIDDLSGRALTDLVAVPAELSAIPTGAEATASIGATPSHSSSRAAVHCRIAAAAVAFLGMECASDKTMCGDGMWILGAQFDTSTRRIRCPRLKRLWLEHAVHLLRSALDTQHAVDLILLSRFVGRLTNLSQFFPEVRHSLEVGYALLNVQWQFAPGTAYRRVHQLKLEAGGRREEQLSTLLEVTLAVARDDVGVSMAPAAHFSAPTEGGVLTLVTDASRAAADDGFGGFAFLPECPGVAFVLSEPWPPHLKEALERAAQSRTDRLRGPAQPALSMPAAEVTASVALAAAVAERYPVRAAIAITDCAPAASAFTSLHSRSSQIHSLLGYARGVIPRWLGVHVRRAWNTDADRLSHPSMAARVVAEAGECGLTVVRLEAPAAALAAASEAARLPLRYVDRSWQQ